MADELEFDVPLSGAIDALRREVVEAIEHAAGQEIRFELGPVEMEFNVQVSRETGRDREIKFWLVAIGDRTDRSSMTSHTIRLALTPVTSGSDGARTGVEVGSKQAQRPD